MTWSYGNDPLNSDLDAVRFLIGDTDSTDPLLQDEEINYLLDSYNVQTASYYAVRSIAAKFARLCREATGDIEVYAHQKYDHYSKLAKQMSADLNSGRPIDLSIFTGGISHSDMRNRNLDTDRNQPPIAEGHMDYYSYEPNRANKVRRDGYNC